MDSASPCLNGHALLALLQVGGCSHDLLEWLAEELGTVEEIADICQYGSLMT